MVAARAVSNPLKMGQGSRVICPGNDFSVTAARNAQGIAPVCRNEQLQRELGIAACGQRWRL